MEEALVSILHSTCFILMEEALVSCLHFSCFGCLILEVGSITVKLYLLYLVCVSAIWKLTKLSSLIMLFPYQIDFLVCGSCGYTLFFYYQLTALIGFPCLLRCPLSQRCIWVMEV